MVMASYAAGQVQTTLVQIVKSGQIGTISVNSNVTATVKRDVSVSSSLNLVVTQAWSADLQDTTSVTYKQLKTQVEESMTQQLLETVGFQGLQVAEFRRTKTNTIQVIVRIVTAQYSATATQNAFVTVVTSGQVTGLSVDNTSAVVQNDVTVSQTAQMTLTQQFTADLENRTSQAFITLQTQLQEALTIQFGNTVGFQRVVVVEFIKSSTNTVVVVVRMVVTSYAASSVQNTLVQTVTSGQLAGISINSNVTATVTKDVTLTSSVVMTLTQSWSADLKDSTSVAFRQLQTKVEESLSVQLLQTVGFQGLQVLRFKQTQSNQVEVVVVIAAAEYAIKQTQQSFVTVVQSGSVGSLSVDSSSVVVKNDSKTSFTASGGTTSAFGRDTMGGGHKQAVVVSQTAQMTLSQSFSADLVNKNSAVFIALQTKLQEAISVQMGNTLGFQRVVVVEFQNSTTNKVVVVMRMVMASYSAKQVQMLYQESVSAGQIGGISVVLGSATVTKDVVASASVSMTIAQSWSADLLNMTSQTYQQLKIQIEEVISQTLLKTVGAQAVKADQFKRTKSGQVEVVLRLAATDYAIKAAQQSVITQVQTGNLGGLAVVNTSALIKKDVTVSQTAQMTLTQTWSADLVNTSSQAYITLAESVQEALSVQLGNTLGFQRVVVVEFKQSSTNTVTVVTRLVVASYSAKNVQTSFAQAVSSGEISGLAVNSTSAVVTKDVSVSSSVTMTVSQSWSAQLQDQSSQAFTTLKTTLEEELTSKMAVITGFQGVQVAQFKRSESGQVQVIVRMAAAEHAITLAQQSFVSVVQTGNVAGVSVDASSASIQKTVTTSQTAQMTLTQAWSADLQNKESVAFTTLQTNLQEALSVELGNTLGFQRVVVTEFQQSSSQTVIVVMNIVVAIYASSSVQTTFTEAVSIGQIGTITVDPASATVTKDVSTSSSVSMTVTQAWSAQLLNTSSTEYVTFKTQTEQALTTSMLNVVGFSGLEVGQLKQSSSGQVQVKLRIVAAEYSLTQAQESFVSVVQSGNVGGISVDATSAAIQKDVTTSQTAEVTLTQAWSADLQNTTSVAFTTLQQKVQEDLSVELGSTVGFQRAVVVEFKQSTTNTVVAVTRLVVATYAASSAQAAFVKTVSSGQIGTIAVNASSATVSKDVSASSTMSMTVTQSWSADLLNSSSTAYQALVVNIEKSSITQLFLLSEALRKVSDRHRNVSRSSGQIEVVVRVVAAEYALAAAQESFVTVVQTGSVADLSLDTTSAVVKKTVTASQTAQMTLTQAWSADLQQTSSAAFTTLQTQVQEALTVELGNTVGFQSVNVVSFEESSTSTVTAVVRLIVVSYATTTLQQSFTQVVSSGQVGTITVNKTSAVVKKDGRKPLIKGTYYRPPSDQGNSLDELDRSIGKMGAKINSDNVIILGNFNTPGIKWDTTVADNSQAYTGQAEKLLNLMDNHGLFQTVQEPTRNGNLLDLVLVNNPNIIEKTSVVPGISDHDMVLVDVNLALKQNRKPKRKVYIRTKADEPAIKKDLTDYATNFHKRTQDINLRRHCRKKQRLYNKAKKTGQEEDWNKYKRVKKGVQKSIRQAHSKYVADILGEAIVDKPKTFWSYIKGLRKDLVGVAPLKVGNTIISDSGKKAEVLSSQFKSVFTEEDTTDMPSLGQPCTPPMEHIVVSTDGVEKMLQGLNPSKASGPDQIPPWFLKLTASEIAPVLTNIFQHSLNTAEIPKDWRDSNICAIFKKGDRAVPSNYRPVSLTCISCKLLEHIIHSQIMKHLESYSILTDYQHGFRAKRSTETQLILTVHDIADALNSKRQVDLAILDFTKAFDKWQAHGRLISKLEYYGIQGPTLNCLKAFLTNREQTVVVEGKASAPVKVASGVPQGTVLGPLLFLLYINDLPDQLDSNVRLFADDCLLYVELSTQTDSQLLQKDLNTLEEWQSKWLMQFNPEKCYIMHITNKRTPHATSYQFCGQALATTKIHPYLGVTLTSGLKWVGLSTTVSMTVTQSWSADLQNTTSQAFVTLQTQIQQAMTTSLQATTGFQAVQVSQFKQTESGNIQVILRIVAAEYSLTAAQESFTTVVETGSVAGVSVDASSAVVQKD
ncbi:hypothetical protein Bbelb_376610, partial [Branchiostoma belcheri]